MDSEERGLIMQNIGTRIAGLMRGIARVDSKGKIVIPINILKAMNLKEENAIELRIVD